PSRDSTLLLRRISGRQGRFFIARVSPLVENKASVCSEMPKNCQSRPTFGPRNRGPKQKQRRLTTTHSKIAALLTFSGGVRCGKCVARNADSVRARERPSCLPTG